MVEEAPTSTDTPAINPGTPKYEGGSISFEGAHHPKMGEAQENFRTARRALREKLASPDIQPKWDELQAKIAQDKLSYKEARVLRDAFRKEHMPEQHEALHAAKNAVHTANVELRGEQVLALGKLETLAGADKEKFTEAAQKFARQTKIQNAVADRHINPTFMRKHFSVLFEGGMGASLQNNFGGKAWKNHVGKTILKGGGVIVGLGAVIDAAMRSEKSGPDGKPVERSWAMRIAEATGGAVLAVGSALHGGRTR